MAKQFRDFESAREFVRSLELKSGKYWKEYVKSGNKPDDIPNWPDGVYKNKGWKGWGDFLGNGNVLGKEWRSFKEAREFVRSLGLNGQREWYAYCKSGNKPEDVPYSPDQSYKNKGWQSYGDWLGTDNISYRYLEYRSLKETRYFVRKFKLKNVKEWFEYCKSGEKPDDIPYNVQTTYKNKGWTTWGDFLGTGRIANKDLQFRSFKEAREFVRSLGLKGVTEWWEYCKSGNKPDDIPSKPDSVYKKEWKGWRYWVGTE